MGWGQCAGQRCRVEIDRKKNINISEHVVCQIVGFDSSRNQRQRWKRTHRTYVQPSSRGTTTTDRRNEKSKNHTAKSCRAPMKAFYICLAIIEPDAMYHFACILFMWVCVWIRRIDSIHKNQMNANLGSRPYRFNQREKNKIKTENTRIHTIRIGTAAKAQSLIVKVRVCVCMCEWLLTGMSVPNRWRCKRLREKEREMRLRYWHISAS